MVAGEAPESDEEDAHFPLSLHPSLHGNVSQLSLYNDDSVLFQLIDTYLV